ncbi:alanine racemase [Sagittula sp. SSi028]|uniref:alanine racemase n=1 Tax=Sagittula sp. SSi028 TaxID=3400636 RepID=UPI003AF686F8
MLQDAKCTTPARWLAREQLDEPVFFYDPAALARQAARFVTHFPGEVTYAVKANPEPLVIEALVQAGVEAFDVASPREMALVRAIAPKARLHYHNPVRSVPEVEEGRAHDVCSWSVDRMSELDKLGDITGQEIAVRLKLPVAGAVYDFGTKFGAPPDLAVSLLQAVAARGGIASMTFHPGTQCCDATAWAQYITACAACARAADVPLHRLNVGGGFPSHRADAAPDLQQIFDRIAKTAKAAFGTQAPALVCEPGRALAADAFDLAVRVKAVEADAVFLNDGIYGGLCEWRDLGTALRFTVYDQGGAPRSGRDVAKVVFGPTCDSLDRLPDMVALPETLTEGDFIVFHGAGAYSTALATSFNGYGARRIVTLMR